MSEPRSGTTSGRIPYVPALDGLRAICVVGVLCFHAGFDWARGGYLGVSTFFTLSGYLVTSILFAGLDAQRAAGVVKPGVGFIDFYARRARRLVPASLLTLLAVMAIAPFWLLPEARVRLGADVLASLFYFVNWRFIFGDYAYALLFTSPSMLQHYWSLAIEAQLYVVLPFIVAVAARSRAPRRVFGLIVGVLIVAGTWLCVVLGADASGLDRVYYGTDTRAPELLIGALLAVSLPARSNVDASTHRRGLDLLFWLVLIGIGVAFARVPLESEALYRGGFTLFAASSAILIVGCVRGFSVSRLLAARPLVWLGEISYGIYLFHWPVYLGVEAWLGDPSPWVVLGLGGGITVVLAAVSYVFIETPIRSGRGPLGRRRVTVLAIGGAALVGLMTATLPMGAVLRDLRPGEGPAQWTGDDRDPPRLAVFGDSVALTFSKALNHWLGQRGQVRWVLGLAPPGCGLLMPDFIREVVERGGNGGRWTRARRDGFGTRRVCLEVPETIDERLRSQQPDLAVSVASMWDLIGLPVSRMGGPARVGTPEIDARLSRLMDERVALLSSQDADVVWFTMPPFQRNDDHPMSQAEIDRARERYNELVWEMAERHAGRVQVLDFAAVFEAWPGGADDPALREDGIHFTSEGGLMLLDRGLGEQLERMAREAQRRRDSVERP